MLCEICKERITETKYVINNREYYICKTCTDNPIKAGKKIGTEAGEAIKEILR